MVTLYEYETMYHVPIAHSHKLREKVCIVWYRDTYLNCLQILTRIIMAHAQEERDYPPVPRGFYD